jgi:hypothetical protein
MHATPKTLIATLCFLLALPACQTLDKATAEMRPYGVQLRDRIAQWERVCKSRKLGPYYDNSPANRGNVTCDFLFLKDVRWDPNADEFSRYAHSFNLPPPHDKPQAIYREGMSSGDYLQELCKKEAGEWIFRTVSNVEGVLQARTAAKYPPSYRQLTPAAVERLPYGSADDSQWLAMATPNPFSYTYFEYPRAAADRSREILRFYRDEKSLRANEPPTAVVHWRESASRRRVPYVVDRQSRAPYAFVGRGVRRPDFDDHGIQGMELLIVDTRTSEVLALRRMFTSTRPAPLSLGRLHADTTGDFCRPAFEDPSASNFIVRVAKPVQLH